LAALSPKQKRFCDEYLVDGNGYRAAVRAKYSKKTARGQASRLLAKANVKDYLASKSQKIEQKLEISAERTLLEIARVAYTPVSAFYDKDGRLIPVHELGPDAAACIAGVEIEEIKSRGKVIGTLKKIKRFDKNVPLGYLAKHFKLFTDAPPAPVTINVGLLSVEELKTLLAIKKKAAT
jgi:phage terminase small subunit